MGEGVSPTIRFSWDTEGRGKRLMFEKECCPECRYVRLGVKSAVYGLTVGLVWVMASIGILKVAGLV